MADETTEYFEVLESLFAQPGWKVFVADFKEMRDAIASQWMALTPENLRAEQGRYEGLNQVVEFEKQVEAVKRANEEARELAAWDEKDNV